MVRVRTFLSVKSLGSARVQAATLSWIVDVNIQISWPHRVTRSNLDFSSSSSSARFDYCVYRTRMQAIQHTTKKLLCVLLATLGSKVNQYIETCTYK